MHCEGPLSNQNIVEVTRKEVDMCKEVGRLFLLLQNTDAQEMCGLQTWKWRRLIFFHLSTFFLYEKWMMAILHLVHPIELRLWWRDGDLTPWKVTVRCKYLFQSQVCPVSACMLWGCLEAVTVSEQGRIWDRKSWWEDDSTINSDTQEKGKEKI